MFDKLYIEDRNLKVGVSKTFTFKYLGNGNIRILADGTQDMTKSTCGCQIQAYDPLSKTVNVVVTPKPVPLARISKGFNYYDKVTQITITFIENGMPKQYILTIQTTIHGQ